MKQHRKAWGFWLLFLLALLALGVYVMAVSPTLVPQPIDEVFPQLKLLEGFHL